MADRRDIATGEPGTSSTATPLGASRINRRQFLGGAAASSLGVAILRPDTDIATHLRDIAVALDRPHAAVVPARPTVSFSITRPLDLCLLDITFYGFTLEKGTKYPSLVATAKASAGLWIGAVVGFPPQAIGEASYFSPQSPPTDPPFDPAPVLSQVAGPSRLAFTFTTGDKVPLKTGNIEDLLDWVSWQLSVAPSVLSGSGVTFPESPTSYQCAIEAPLNLTMSPVGYSVASTTKSFFTNRVLPFVSPRLVTECWTTSLAGTYLKFEPDKAAPHIVIGGVTTPMTPLVAVVMSTDYSTASNPTTVTPESRIVYSYLAPPPP